MLLDIVRKGTSNSLTWAPAARAALVNLPFISMFLNAFNRCHTAVALSVATASFVRAEVLALLPRRYEMKLASPFVVVACVRVRSSSVLARWACYSSVSVVQSFPLFSPADHLHHLRTTTRPSSAT